METLLQTEDFLSLLGGSIILFYLAWQVIEKAFGNVSWIKTLHEKRDKKQREKKEKEITILVKDVVIPPIIQEIEDINDKQNRKLDDLLRSSNDTLRIELLRLYFNYRPYKKIPQWAKEAAVKLHDDYIKQDGNTFVQDLWMQMSTWEVVPGEEDLKIE